MATTTTTTKRTALDEAHDQLVSAVEQLIKSDDWMTFLSMAAKFHRYSLNNVLLILNQMPTATQVASYTTWQGLGRQVRKGERGIKILAPCRYRTDVEVTTGKAGDTYEVRGFRLVSVFDVSQTDGDSLPTVASPVLLEGEAPEGMWDAIKSIITADGFTVEVGDVGIPDANGVTRFLSKEVIVAERLSNRAAAKTLCHELAHVRLHKDTLNARPREVLEVEAESTAYLVAHAWGLDTTDYSIPYVAHWAQSTELVKETMQRVITAARLIISECPLD